MTDQISNIRLKFACPADWDSMQTIDGVKFCGHCQKNVYDFTDAKVQEFAAILAINGNHICGRFKAEQMAPQHFILPVWKKWVSAALVLVGINVFNYKAEAQSVKQKTIKLTDAKVTDMPILGMVNTGEELTYDRPAEFPGGTVEFQKFVAETVHFTKDMVSGKVLICFNVNENGTLSNYHIIQGPALTNEQEAIRILKLSPNWKPATLKGKPVKTTYLIPIAFER